MRFFEKAILNSYYWNDEKIKDLHESVIKRTIGTYKGFFSNYGQAIRINKMDLIQEKEIIKDIDKGNKLKKNKYIIDYIKEVKSEVNNTFIFLNSLERKFIDLLELMLLDYTSIRAG